jgi:site-specific recombinase XerD
LFPQSEIEDFRKYWRRRKPGNSTAVHYSSDVCIFFKWADGRSPEAITVHDVDRFIVWQQSRGHTPATVTRRPIALRMFYDYLACARDHALANPVVPRRHYVYRGRRRPRNLTEEVIQRLFAAIGEHHCRQAGIWLTCHQLRHTYRRSFGRLINASKDVAR